VLQQYCTPATVRRSCAIRDPAPLHGKNGELNDASLKNMFGTIPGSVYGWPKNVVHWKETDRSILDINSTMPVHFVIADGIVALEGNGPLHGAARDP
jgi:hypothetical protein